MGESRRRSTGIGKCIYCGNTANLSREHVLPYGLGGNIILKDASCPECSELTSKLELRLLRGHWWPYRQFLGAPSRRASEIMPDLAVKILCENGLELEAHLPMSKQSIALVFEFDPPSILSGVLRTDEPNAPRVYMKQISALPTVVKINGENYALKSSDKINIPINFDAADLTRFLAKVAHGYAISRRGIKACNEFLLPPIILGNTTGAQTYVGGAHSPFLGSRLPGSGLHAMMDRINNGFLTVYIQLFRDNGDPPPIYEIVVGRI